MKTLNTFNSVCLTRTRIRAHTRACTHTLTSKEKLLLFCKMQWELHLIAKMLYYLLFRTILWVYRVIYHCLLLLMGNKQTQCIFKLWTTSLVTYYCTFIINVFLSQFNCKFDTLKNIKIKLEKFNNKPQSNLSECGSSKAMRWHNAYRMSWNEVTWLWGRWSIRWLTCFRFSGWIPRAAGLDDYWQYLILEEFLIYIGAQCFG